MQNLDAERDLLGAILLNNKALYKVTNFLRPEHFSEEVHQRIFDAILKASDKQMTADPVTMNAMFAGDADFEEVGGAGKYFAKLAASATTVINANQYGRVIYDCWKKRELDAIADNIKEMVGSGTGADEISDNTVSKLFMLAGDRTGQIVSIGTAIENAITSLDTEMKGEVKKVSTGISSINYRIGGGMKSPHLIILAGRPGMGKTALALNISYNAATSGKKGLFFSLEMGQEELAIRLACREARIDSNKVDSGDITENEFHMLMEAQGRIANKGLFIDDTPSLNIEQVSSRARGFKERQDIDFIVVDHIQRMSDPAGVQRANRTLSLGKTVQGLKNLAKSLQIPVVALSQLSRSVESRENKRPMLSDLRESGEIEQEADVVAFLYRHAYYLEREARECTDENKRDVLEAELMECRNKCEFIVAKRRSGAVGSSEIMFQPEFAFFSDLQR